MLYDRGFLYTDWETTRVALCHGSTVCGFYNRGNRKIGQLNVRVITNEELWERTGQKPLDRQIKKRKWSWIGHTLCKPSGITEKDALDWNPQGKRRRGRLKKTWKRTVEEESRD